MTASIEDPNAGTAPPCPSGIIQTDSSANMQASGNREQGDQPNRKQKEPPRPLHRKIPDSEEFPVEALGEVLSAAARAIHDRVQAPVSNHVNLPQ